MKTWQYKTETYEIGRQDKSVTEAMSIAGQDGWEAFRVVEGEKFIVVWFKKEISS